MSPPAAEPGRSSTGRRSDDHAPAAGQPPQRRYSRPVGPSTLWNSTLWNVDGLVPTAPDGRPAAYRAAASRESPRRTATSRDNAGTGGLGAGRDHGPAAPRAAAAGSAAVRRPRAQTAASSPSAGSARRGSTSRGRSGSRGSSGPGRPVSWRLIAIPFLLLITAVVAFQAFGSPNQPTSASVPGSTGTSSKPQPTNDTADPPSAGPTPTSATDLSGAAVLGTPLAQAVPDPAMNTAGGHIAATITAGALPIGPDIVATGAGTWHTVPGAGQPHGTGAEVRTYSIEVEDGLESAEADQVFAAAVDATLADPRSWIGGGQVSLQRVDAGEPSFRIALTSQMTIRSPDLCGWDVPLEASCFNGWAGRVLINDARWVRGAMSFGTDVDSYRAYAVNHEVGHALGFSHQPCPDNGAPAPVMMQQSWSTADNDLNLLDPETIPADGKVCVANPYPYPGSAQPPTTSPSTAAG